jgi:hypothetical protein
MMKYSDALLPQIRAVRKHIFPSPEPAEGTIHIVVKFPPARECG